MMKRIILSLFVLVVLGALLPCQVEDANAQLVWRVSVKFILSAGGNRPASGNINTTAEVNNQIDTANLILDAMGRGYRLHDERFESYDTSGLEFTVVQGKNELTLVVDR